MKKSIKWIALGLALLLVLGGVVGVVVGCSNQNNAKKTPDSALMSTLLAIKSGDTPTIDKLNTAYKGGIFLLNETNTGLTQGQIDMIKQYLFNKMDVKISNLKQSDAAHAVVTVTGKTANAVAEIKTVLVDYKSKLKDFQNTAEGKAMSAQQLVIKKVALLSQALNDAQDKAQSAMDTVTTDIAMVQSDGQWVIDTTSDQNASSLVSLLYGTTTDKVKGTLKDVLGK